MTVPDVNNDRTLTNQLIVRMAHELTARESLSDDKLLLMSRCEIVTVLIYEAYRACLQNDQSMTHLTVYDPSNRP